MESLDEITKDVKAFLYERLSNPFPLIFLVSWVIWNFRLVMMLFSGESVDTKFLFMDNHFQSTNSILMSYGIDYSGYLFNALCAPLTLTLIYVFLTPIVSLPVYVFSLAIKKNMVNAKVKSESKHLMSVEDARVLRLKHAQMKLKYETELDDANNQIETLSQELIKKQSQQAGWTTDAGDLPDSNIEHELDIPESESLSKFSTHHLIDDTQHKILEVFANGDDEQIELTLITKLKPINRHIVKKALEELSNIGWLKPNVYLDEDRRAYRIMPTGRSYIVENILSKKKA